LWAGWAAGGLVVVAGVDGQLVEEFAGGGVDDADVEVVDLRDHVGSGVGSSDAYVVQPSGQAEGDDAGWSMRSWRHRDRRTASGARGDELSYLSAIVSSMGELVERMDEQDRVLGVVDRDEAIANHWLHRVATTVCRDPEGRVLVHRRQEGVSRFPGQYDWLIGGAAEVGESYEEAAVRELAEELGVDVPVRFVFKFLCRGAISPYWLGVHEAVVTGVIAPDPSEIAAHHWVTENELREALRRWTFVPDGVDALRRYLARPTP
jgi:isopentenyldiphosphate isomerase